MSITTQVLAELRGERLKRDAEEARWAQYRREASSPAWIVIVVVLAALGGMIGLAAFMLKHPEAIRSPFGLLIVPCSVVLLLALSIEKRREKTFLRIVRDEAPALYEKLKEERLVR
jgi:peptidoglycan/LPS O-acetylase OafA/YrhL